MKIKTLAGQWYREKSGRTKERKGSPRNCIYSWGKVRILFSLHPHDWLKSLGLKLHSACNYSPTEHAKCILNNLIFIYMLAAPHSRQYQCSCITKNQKQLKQNHNTTTKNPSRSWLLLWIHQETGKNNICCSDYQKVRREKWKGHCEH